MLNKKVKANSLIITIIISLVIGLFCSLLILLAYFNREAELTYKIDKTLNRNLNSAINILLSDTIAQDGPKKDSLDLFGEGNDSVFISMNCWGLYNIANVRARKGRISEEKTFLYGAALPSSMDGCIYMADHKRPLYLVGNTILAGDAYVSTSGIKASYIDQRGYSRDHLLDGKIKTSKDYLPGISVERLNLLRQLLKQCRENNKEDRSFLLVSDSLSQSFNDITGLIFSHGPLSLSEQVLSGNIMIFSDSSIEVEATARLNNVILVAPEINVKRGFSGSLQLIAANKLEIGNNCTLSYPSSAIIIKDDAPSSSCSISIGDSTKFTGVIFAYAPFYDLTKTRAIFKKGSVIEGVVYVCGFTESGGTLYGTIATDFFLYRSGASVYENHLVNVEINRNKLFPYFVGSSLFTGFDKSKIIQWIQ